MEVAVVVPFDDGGDPYRARNWRHVRSLYETHHPDWPIHVGTCEGTWSKGQACRNAVAGVDAEVLVVADADSFTDPDTLTAAVALAARGHWVVPHRLVFRLDEPATFAVFDGHPPNRAQLARRPYTGVAAGGILVIPRTMWDLVGGFDPRFEGWGGEDVSLAMALTTLVGGRRRLRGDLFHLWHPHPAPNLRGSPASEELVARYRRANRKRDAMAALVAEHQEVTTR